MNEEIIPRLQTMGFVKPGLYFKYSKRIEMSNEDRIKLYSLITERYEVSNDEIEKEFGVIVGKQINLETGGTVGNVGVSGERHVMSEEEYYKRYNRYRAQNKEMANFLAGVK